MEESSRTLVIPFVMHPCSAAASPLLMADAMQVSIPLRFKQAEMLQGGACWTKNWVFSSTMILLAEYNGGILVWIGTK